MKGRALVKICGLTRLVDAELALELGADALGFVLEPSSKRSIHENLDALSIPSRLGPYAMCVAVLGPYRPVPAQFSLVQCIDDLPKAEMRPALKVLRLEPGETVDSILASIKGYPAVLLDAHHPSQFGGTGQTVNWELSAEVAARTSTKVILAGGLTPENVAEAIRKVQPYAVDVSGGVETEPGIKDATKLRAFFEAVNGEKLRER